MLVKFKSLTSSFGRLGSYILEETLYIKFTFEPPRLFSFCKWRRLVQTETCCFLSRVGQIKQPQPLCLKDEPSVWKSFSLQTSPFASGSIPVTPNPSAVALIPYQAPSWFDAEAYSKHSARFQDNRQDFLASADVSTPGRLKSAIGKQPLKQKSRCLGERSAVSLTHLMMKKGNWYIVTAYGDLPHFLPVWPVLAITCQQIPLWHSGDKHTTRWQRSSQKLKLGAPVSNSAVKYAEHWQQVTHTKRCKWSSTQFYSPFLEQQIIIWSHIACFRFSCTAVRTGQHTTTRPVLVAELQCLNFTEPFQLNLPLISAESQYLNSCIT